MSAKLENTYKEEEERQPLQLTTDVKRPSIENELTSRQEDNSPTEDLSLRTSFILGSGRHQDRHVDIVDNEIILASNRSPFRNVTFTLNHWAHLMAALNDIDTAVKKGLIPPMKMNLDVVRLSVEGIWQINTISESSLAYDVSTFENILYLTGINPLKFAQVRMESPSVSMNGRICWKSSFHL